MFSKKKNLTVNDQKSNESPFHSLIELLIKVHFNRWILRRGQNHFCNIDMSSNVCRLTSENFNWFRF